MRSAPTAMAAGQGPSGEPLVYVFDGNDLVRRILQGPDGKPIEEWTDQGVPHRYPFSATGIGYRTLWPCLSEAFDGQSPVALFRLDEEVGRSDYTFHAVLPVGPGHYRRVSWLHTSGELKARGTDPFRVPSTLTLTAACELADSNVLLFGSTADEKCAYAVWDSTTHTPGRVSAVPGPATPVCAAFLGYDTQEGEQVMRVYTGADGREEYAFTVTAKNTGDSAYVFTPRPTAPEFLAAAE